MFVWSRALLRAMEILAALTTMMEKLDAAHGKGAELAEGPKFTTIPFAKKKVVLLQNAQISQYQKRNHQRLTC